MRIENCKGKVEIGAKASSWQFPRVRFGLGLFSLMRRAENRRLVCKEMKGSKSLKNVEHVDHLAGNKGLRVDHLAKTRMSMLIMLEIARGFRGFAGQCWRGRLIMWRVLWPGWNGPKSHDFGYRAYERPTEGERALTAGGRTF